MLQEIADVKIMLRQLEFITSLLMKKNIDFKLGPAVQRLGISGGSNRGA